MSFFIYFDSESFINFDSESVISSNKYNQLANIYYGPEVIARRS